MTQTKTTTVAKVTISIELELHDNWGDDCTIAQISKQSKDAATSIINHAVQEAARYAKGEPCMKMNPVLLRALARPSIESIKISLVEQVK